MIRFPWKLTEGERGRSLRAMACSSFFDGRVGRNLCPKKCLTTSKTVMCVCGGGGGGGGGGGVFKLRYQSGNH